MKVQYDSRVDALYIQLRDIAPVTAEARELTTDVTGDFGPDGKLVGIEILDASKILALDDLHRVVLEVAPAL